MPTAFLLFGCLFVSALALGAAIHACQLANRTNHRPCVRRFNEINAALADAEGTIERLSKALRKLQMRKVTESRTAAQQNSDGTPDPKTDPEGWKSHMRKQLQLQRFGANK